MSPVQGAWVPNWRFDAICLEATLAARLGTQYRLGMRAIAWHRNVQGAALQIIAPTVEPAWFDPDALRAVAESRHGSAGRSCPECGVWRWLPLPLELLPPVQPSARWDDHDVVASPEWFGDGARSFREVLVRRKLAQAIASASPKDFKLTEISRTSAVS
jgi:hypothetical protein